MARFRSRPRARRAPAALRAALVLACHASYAQAPTSPTPTPPPPTSLDKVEVKGERATETEERRESTVAKIIVGRDDIERYGDTSVSEIMKRLPGVTVEGAPRRRGGAIRLRGLGSGYTQILLDGERVPTGFSLDSLTPEQIERIEILRAPTAETGARAIAGTINIITRDGVNRSINDLRISTGFEHGRPQPSVSWTRGDRAGAWNYNVSASIFRDDRRSESETTTVDERLDDGSVTLAQREAATTTERRNGASLTSRLQWRGEEGRSLVLTPALTYSDGRSRREARLAQSVGATPALYDRAVTDGDDRAGLARLNATWRQPIGEDTRLELRGGLRESRSDSQSRRNEFDAAGRSTRTLDDDADTRDRRYSAGAKIGTALGDDHQFVSGVEAETARRTETRTTLQDGAPILAEFGDNLTSSSSRYAAYAQAEWTISPQWAAHAGLRWEGITTRGDDVEGRSVRNRSSVWTPLAHAVWKPNPAGRDQLRMSLTRSYRAPTLQNLIARPSVSTRFPVPGSNLPTSPDRAGNPDLRPELATGIDLAYEHYIPGGGLLSANVFRRNIRDLIRSVTTLENVSWADVPRWVARPQNVGDAVTQGLELEARVRLTDIWSEAAPVDVRANASFFRSRVSSVPGPNNRLDQQPSWTANLGADYRLRRVPLTLGGNVNGTPAYTTRISNEQSAFQGRKTLVDAFALWTINPSARLRFSASNLAARDFVTSGTIDTDTVRETARTVQRTSIFWQVRLELKL